MQVDEQNTQPIDLNAEVVAMGKVVEALKGLQLDAVARVLGWASNAYKVEVKKTETRKVTPDHDDEPNDEVNGNGDRNGNRQARFVDLAELYAATSPDSEADKTLVAAYSAQFLDNKPEFGAFEINQALKNLGHPIGHITTAFDTLKARKPALVMQLKKAGTSKQARKTYRLTLAGKSAVEAMVGQG